MSVCVLVVGITGDCRELCNPKTNQSTDKICKSRRATDIYQLPSEKSVSVIIFAAMVRVGGSGCVPDHKT